jgi:D-alanyl-lipoteichoic acid acyltransferase DltB (MBOAT superfamily)
VNFASYDFWKFLILCFIGSRLILAVVRQIRPQAESTTAKLCLLATALILLTSESPLTLGAFLWVVILGWLCVLLQSAQWPVRAKHILFLLLLAAQLAPLFYFKYWNFVFNEVLGLDLRLPSVLIPMGLSFYTFQTIGFWIDNLRAPQPRPRFLDYLNFASFFPQIVAGPIEKRELLLPQIEGVKFRIHRANLNATLQWIILGLGYKLIVADNLGNLSDKFQLDSSNAWQVWFECLVFGIRIYFDFAGYSFIAVGLGLLFGVHLTLNFRCPYWSKDLREFWRNWHVTLGAWLRDYIYLPLGGKRVRWWAANTLIVFLVSGIWHGAGWGFLIWGLLHGIGVVVCGLRANWLRFAPLQLGVTFLYCTGAWLFFLERNPELLRQKALTMIQPTAYSLGNLHQLIAVFPGPTNTVTTAFILLFALVALALEGIGIRKNTEPYHLARRPVASILLVFLIILLAPMEESSFIYFNF